MDASLRWHDGLEHWRAMIQRDPGSGAGVTGGREAAVRSRTPIPTWSWPVTNPALCWRPPVALRTSAADISAAAPIVQPCRLPRFVAPCGRVARWIGRFAECVHLADRIAW